MLLFESMCLEASHELGKQTSEEDGSFDILFCVES